MNYGNNNPLDNSVTAPNNPPAQNASEEDSLSPNPLPEYYAPTAQVMAPYSQNNKNNTSSINYSNK